MEPHFGKRWLIAFIVTCAGPQAHVLWKRQSLLTWLNMGLLFGIIAFVLAPLLSILLPGTFLWRPDRVPSLMAIVPLKALKEEVFFRALPFALLANAAWTGRQKPLLSRGGFVLVSSIVFIAAHEVNFRYLQGDPMSLSTLITLGFFGVLTGALFLRQGHLLGCLALHAGWNVMRFQVDILSSQGAVLEGSASFALLEGSWVLLSLTGILAFVLVRSLTATSAKPTRHQSEESPSRPSP